MGGPWRSREFDAATWQPPAPHTEPDSDHSSDKALAIVIAYVVSVTALSGLMLAVVLKYGHGW